MKKLLIIPVIALFFYSCSSQKETEKPKVEEMQPVVVEKKKELNFNFESQNSGTSSSLRAISVIDSLTAWASGSKGTFLRTTDGGKTWLEGKVKGFETLDFRDIEAFGKNSAIMMCIDAPAYFFKTTDGGKNWKRKYMNRDPKIFFDGFAFYDEENGIGFSDPIDGKFFIVKTKDGGNNWREIPSMNIPPVIKGESGFAASGTSISILGKDLVWIGTGGGDRSRIFFSQDAGENWRAVDSKMKSGNSTSGVFSIAFKDDLNGIAVGGDYKNNKDKTGNAAFSEDGGLSWNPIDKNQPNGLKSCVAWNEQNKFYLTTGTSGSDFSTDDGKTWTSIDQKSFNSIGISKTDGSVFLVGDGGAVARVKVTVTEK
jgi:photosystem II stability/assembly factor-like uncharacterized protein